MSRKNLLIFLIYFLFSQVFFIHFIVHQRVTSYAGDNEFPVLRELFSPDDLLQQVLFLTMAPRHVKMIKNVSMLSEMMNSFINR